MIRRPPRSTRTDTLFPTRRSSDLQRGGGADPVPLFVQKVDPMGDEAAFAGLCVLERLAQGRLHTAAAAMAKDDDVAHLKLGDRKLHDRKSTRLNSSH